MLEERGDKTIVYNHGVVGFVSSELLEVTDVCVTDLKPSKVFINIGTNDLSWDNLPISQLIYNYDKIITAVEAALPYVKIYLMAYYPVNYESAADNMKECLRIRTNEKIAAANSEVDYARLKRFDLCFADWRKNPTNDFAHGIWQYSETGKVNGINGNVGLDIVYKDYPAIIKKARLNGYSKNEDTYRVTAEIDGIPSEKAGVIKSTCKQMGMTVYVVKE